MNPPATFAPRSSTLALGSRGEIVGLEASGASTAEARVIAANRSFYSQIAKKYDLYEACSSDSRLQRMLEKDLDSVQSCFTLLRRTPLCLDCGGGTGNLALKMLHRGWTVTVVDVSGEMLNLLKEKAGAAGYSPRLVNLPIERFLEATRETYDLVAFSSVLHHLYSYTSVVQQVASVVRPEGIFYSNYDPAVPKRPFLTRAFDSLDIAFAKVMLDPPDVLPGIGRRLKKLFSPMDPTFNRVLVSAGDLAEYRARAGVNDMEIIELLQRNGFSVVEHLRYPVGRTRAVRFLNERFRLLGNFKIIARRHSRFTETSRDSGQANPV